MEAWMACVSILGIIAIVFVGGGIIAFIAHMILGTFQSEKTESKSMVSEESLDYAQYKQLETNKVKQVEKDYDFEAINAEKLKKEKEMLAKDDGDIYGVEPDVDLQEIENRLKAKKEALESKVDTQAQVTQGVPVIHNEDENEDDVDFENMLSEISDEVIEEEKSQINNDVTMSEELASYSIDDILHENEEYNMEDTINEEQVSHASAEEINNESKENLSLPIYEEPVQNNRTPIVAIPYESQSKQDLADLEIHSLKMQLEALNKQLQEEREGKTKLQEINKQLETQVEEQAKLEEKVEVVRIDMTEEECEKRIQTLEERLKSVKKDYKSNAKEYRPLKKVINDLEHYQTKLRRKEAVVAKKKVALYGVNNYVDIDKEKAEKLANELELLDGLRLSVSHCEELIEANKDRFPVLEHTNQILEDQIAHIEADIETYKEMLKKIRERNGNGEGNNDQGTNE